MVTYYDRCPTCDEKRVREIIKDIEEKDDDGSIALIQIYKYRCYKCYPLKDKEAKEQPLNTHIG